MLNIFNAHEIEKEVQKIWAEQKIPEKIVSMDWKKKKFYLLDGPPYVNGVPHVGHSKTTTFKDVWGKFKFMNGFAVWFQPGFDCGGLPIENAVEKRLGIKSKSEIETVIGVDRFIEECKKLAGGNEPVWLNFYKKIGAWRGWLNPYLTSENYYLESGWWTIKKWFERGLFIEGFRPGFWCPHCETVLAGIEASESYKDIEDTSIFVKFKVKDKDEFLLVWTTTPWTLFGNVAVAVHPDETYVKARVGKEVYIIAEKRLAIFEELGHGYTIIEKMNGKKLSGLKYEPILDVPSQNKLKKNKNSHKVIVSIPVMKKRVASKMLVKSKISEEEEFGHLVAMDTGTGLVHIAPGHGESDNRLGKQYKLPEISPVDEKGRLTEEAGEFAGIFVKDADKFIIEKLQKTGKLFYSHKIVHSYPLCWRCKTPLIYRMSRQWFVNLDKLRGRIIKANQKIKWLPEFAKERYHNTIAEAPDWAVTRQRYWGIPLPVWTCEKCKKRKIIGSKKELIENAAEKLPDSIDLHKNSVDKITIKCSCGSGMKREKDIMDVWFDSGISPWASLGYPFRNKDLFEKLWKVDLVDESQDQVRAWFHTLMLCGFATFDKAPYKTVCLNGWTLDEFGEKMSKSLGNVIFADDAYNEIGADLLRLYYCYDIAAWETQKFSMKNAKELGRAMNILLNTYNYFKTYGKTTKRKEKLQLEDEWILSRLNTLIKNVAWQLENFEFHTAGRGIVDFIVNDFSRTYIKLVRNRESPNFVFTIIFDNLLRLMAPITPFISEYIYHDMKNESVHLAKWPRSNEKMINEKLEKDMKIVDALSEAANSIRKEKGIKLKWPLPLIAIDAKIGDKKIKEIIKKLCNVKDVKFGKEEQLEQKKFEHGAIYLDLNVLKDEALLREVVRKIQDMRKKTGLVVTDKIKLLISSAELKKFEQKIKKEVGAKEIIFEDNNGEPVKFEDIEVRISIKKV